MAAGAEATVARGVPPCVGYVGPPGAVLPPEGQLVYVGKGALALVVAAGWAAWGKAGVG